MNPALTFIVLAVGLIAIVLGVLCVALWRGAQAGALAAQARDAARDNPALANAAVYRDQLVDLEREHALGNLNDQELQIARDELSQRLLDDVGPAELEAPHRKLVIAPPRKPWVLLTALIVLVPIALYINWRLALVLIILCIVFVWLTHFILRKTQTLQQQVEGHHSDLAEQASDTLGNIALVQSFARIEHEVSALKDISQRVLGAQMPVLSWWALVNVLTRSATTLSILCIVALGAWLFTKGQTSVGAIVTFISFSGMVIMRLEQIVGFVHRLAMEAPRLQEFFHVLDTEPSIHDSPHAIDLGRARGAIAFENVTFAYDKKNPAVKGLSFTLKPGTTIALVGASGAGKSTALSLLYRAFDPQSGRITVDGHDIRDLQLAALRSNIGVVFQEALLFNRSIADNLKVGLPEATDAQLRQACANAQALDFIEQHPQGFDTKIGERGRALSGGERQRLSIARVLLKNPPVLILDEATSALDSATETKLLQALDAVTKDRSTLVIAHRLATIRKADKILVMDHGTIVEAGSFDELYAQGGRFTQLVKEQFSDASGNFIS